MKKFKVIVSPDGMGETTIGITGHRSEVCDLVDEWIQNSEFRGEIIGDSDYVLAEYIRHDNEVMDFEI